MPASLLIVRSTLPASPLVRSSYFTPISAPYTGGVPVGMMSGGAASAPGADCETIATCWLVPALDDGAAAAAITLVGRGSEYSVAIWNWLNATTMTSAA